MASLAFKISPFHLDGLFVDPDGGLVVTHAHVNVRGHVYEMARARRECAQPVGARQRPLRMRGLLDGVDVIVVGAEVVRLPPQDRFEDADNLLRPFRGLAVQRPQFPGTQVHGALGKEGGSVQVVGVALGHLPHCLRVGLQELFPIHLGVR